MIPSRDATAIIIEHYSVFSPEQIDSFIDLWDGPGRVYHSSPHLFLMIRDLRDMGQLFDLDSDEMRELVLSALFHDIVYVAGAKDNEQQSADLAFRAIRPQAMGFRVATNIMKTVDHLHPDTFLQACLLDADLAGLGRDYENNGARIRAEYPPELCTEEQWLHGRVAFLTKMLSRETIFFTSWGAQFEDSATNSMYSELESCHQRLRLSTT